MGVHLAVRRAGGWVGAVVAACACAACTLTVSTDGLTPIGGTGASDGGPRDAAVAADARDFDASPPDAARGDGSPNDETFVTGETGVFWLAASPDELFWITPQRVAACKLAGCAQPRVLSNGATPSGLAWSGRALWTRREQPAVFFETADGGVGQMPMGTPSTWIAVDGDDGYVTDSGHLVKLIGNIAASGPDSDTTFLGFDPATAIGRFVASLGRGLAWTEQDGSVHYCGAGGCTQASSIVVPSGGALGLALDAGLLAWTTTDGRVRSVQHDANAVTSAPADLAAGLPEPAAVAIDAAGSFIYVASRGTAAASYADGTVVKVPRGGGPVTILARGQAQPSSVVVAGAYVYWANTYDATIRRAPK